MVLSDPASCANHDQVQLEKLEIEWLVDFDNKVLEGETTQTFRVIKNNVTSINLDCRDITIESIDVNETPADYTRTPQYEGKNVFGDKLSISTAEHAPGSVIKVHIRFKTSSKAGAVQWISTEQTTDHIQPSAFTFCQPIGARSILPCMDTPIVKCPVYSKLSVPSTTIGLMAAIRVGEVEKDKPRNGYDTYSYEQTIPIPSYLISFIVGVFECQDISDRIRVWAEPSMLAKAAYEFANSEESLKLAENLFGDFVWKRSDMIVLPKSFPLGGMENPCLIFVNPTIITGDRSETMLLIHEQIHAWWGNLVTNASWGDMWLNEGFTTYFERRIGALLYGEQYRQFSNLKAWSSILEPLVFERFSPSHPYTRLIIDQSGGIDPNEAFSLNYYEKGQVFLYFLETKIGREDFDTYCRNYLETFARKTVDSITWKQHFIGFFRKKTHLLEDIDFDAWMYGPGLPPIKPK
ncbi:unnamed protein product [Anisakis simplex]|uniref:Leukotriene A-4 hydrolase (inferred by orthology to a human protein) n=1 Tax=Anisakis simplex TaxID=6269 RepID=A0A0M3J028_ANISI|nr:unnamed protein product [Anisakis simplex]